MRFLRILLAGLWFVSAIALGVTVEPNLNRYKVYQADLNGDAQPDYYFHGVFSIVLLHGDISIPLSFPAPSSFLVYSHGDGFLAPLEETYSEAQILSRNLTLSNATSSTLQNVIASSLTGNGMPPAPVDFSYALTGSNTIPNFASFSPVNITQGQAAVSSGSASYKVGIKLPPAIANLAPELSFNYYSQKSDGQMGIGWSLEGIPYITRCATSYSIEGADKAAASNAAYTNADRLCLGGVQLIVKDNLRPTDAQYWTAGTEFRTEIDSFARITGHGASTYGGFDYLTVITKEGKTLTFGGDDSAQSTKVISNKNGTHRISSWALSKVEDRYGNTYSVNYTRNTTTNEHYPASIYFAPNSSVVFKYQDRTGQTVSGYDAGAFYIRNKLLDTVTTYIGVASSSSPESGTPVRRYDVNYTSNNYTQRDLVSDISECGYESGNWRCAKPLLFTWSEGAFGLDMGNPTVLKFCSGSVFDANGNNYTDIDGDGYNDALSSATGVVNWGTASGCFESKNISVSGTVGQGVIISAQPLRTSNGFALLRVRKLTPSPESNSSGYPNPRTFTAEILYDLDKVDGTAKVQVIGTLSSLHASASIADFNNDGLDDFRFGKNTFSQVNAVSFTQSGVPSNYYETYSVSPGQTTTVDHLNVDTDSDGLLDDISTFEKVFEPAYPSAYFIGIKGKNFNISGNSAAPFKLTDSCGGIYDSVGHYRNVGDINSDGLIDFVVHRSGSWHYRLGNGSGVSEEINTGVISSAPPMPGPHYSFMYDYDKDGRDDLIAAVPSGSNMCKSGRVLFSRDINGVISLNDINVLIPYFGFLCTPVNDAKIANTFPGDINNDGLVDAYFGGKAYFSRQGQPNMLASVTDGLGAETKFYYGNLTSENNNGQPLYIPSATKPVFPAVHTHRGMQVVKKLEMSDGKGGYNTRYYNYEGAKTDIRGRGFLGFEKITETDVAAGLKAITENYQDYPYIGFVKNQTVKSLSDLLISRVDNYYTLRSTGNVALFPAKYLSVASTYELLTSDVNSPVSVVRTEVNEHNQCGDVAVVTEQVGTSVSGTTLSGVQSQTVVTNSFNTFTNCENSFLTGSTTSITKPSSNETQTTTSAFVPNAQNDLNIYTEYKGTAQEMSVTYGRQANGVINSIKSSAKDYTGAALPDREKVLSNFASSLYPQKITNEEGHVTTVTYDARFGQQSVSYFGSQQHKTETVFDSLGNATTVVAHDGTRTNTYSFYCNGTVTITCAQGSAYGVATIVTNPASPGYYGQQPVVVFYDRLQREIRKSIFGFNGVVTNIATDYYADGTLARVSAPYTTQGLLSGVATTVRWTSYSSYDVLGRPRTILAADGGRIQTSFAIDVNGVKTTIANSVVAPDGTVTTQVTAQFQNSLGQIVRSQDALNNYVDYTYDAAGNLESTMVNSDLSTLIQVDYDLAGNKIYLNDPDAKRMHFDYNGFGELRRQIWQKDTAAQKSMVFAYDRLGRLTTRTDNPVSGSPIVNTWIWDTRQSGMLSSRSGNGYTDNFYYDGASRVSRRVTDISGLSSQSFGYFYDNFSRPEVESYPNNFKIERKYHSLGYLARVNDVTNPLALGTLWSLGNRLDGRGNLTHSLFGNGVMTRLGFSYQSGRIENIQSGKLTEANTIDSFKADTQNLGYSFDTANNLRKRTSDRTYADGAPREALEETFGYDLLNRLKRTVTRYGGAAGALNFGGNETSEVIYDPFGNITSKTRYESGSSINTDVGSYQYEKIRNAGPHAVTAVGGTQYGYDAYGNMIQRGIESIEYSVFNKPTRIAGASITYLTYGPDHELYKEVSGGKTTYKMGGYELEISGTKTVQKSYVDGKIINSRTLNNGVLAEDTLLYLHMDYLGSLETTTNSTGVIVNRSSFDSWGNRRQPTWAKGTPSDIFVTPTGYTGHHQLDAHKLVHMGGRVYDPAISRFLSADIFVQSPFNTQNYNRYSYVINNPLSLNDPSGYCYGGPDSISQMMMNLASQQIESMHIANVMDTMRSINNYSVNKAISNATNKLITELGLKFNDDKTLIVDRNGKAFLSPAQAKLDRASGESSNSTEATSVSATQVAGASVGGASSNGALTDVLGGDVNQGSAIARKWSTEGSPVDYFTVSEVGGASGMDSSMQLMCGLKCQLHAFIHGWGSKSSLSVGQVYRSAEIGSYIGMVTPAGFLGKQVTKKGVGQAWSGSGPAIGILGLNAASKSNKAILSYFPKKGKSVEFIFDMESKTFLVGTPGRFKHYQLANSIGAKHANVVGGMFSRGKNGEFITNEYSGTFWTNWNSASRSEFVNAMQQFGIKVSHSR